MGRISREDQVEFLVKRKFPEILGCSGPTASASRHIGPILVEEYSGTIFDDNSGQRILESETRSYETKLLSMPSDELNALYENEVEQNKRALEAKAREIDAFYDHPAAAADFRYWCKAAVWTLDEAIALSLAKSPEVVNWARAEEDVKISRFAKKYEQIRNLVLRAEQAGELSGSVRPREFLAWAKQHEVDCPPELVELVKARDDTFQDWKAQYEKLAADFNEFKSSSQGALDAKDGEIADLTKERDQLLELNAELTQDLKEQKALGETPNTKVLNSLQKIAIGIAVEQYDFHPKNRNNAAKQIVEDLAGCGISINEDTVRARLREAAEDHLSVPLPE